MTAGSGLCGEREILSVSGDVIFEADIDSESSHEARIFLTSSFVDLTGMAQGVITVLSSAKCLTNRSSSSILMSNSITHDKLSQYHSVPGVSAVADSIV